MRCLVCLDLDSNAPVCTDCKGMGGKARAWEKAILRDYGLSIQDFYDIAHIQNYECGICSKHLKRIHIDHNHITGRVRGILCPSCNMREGRWLFSDHLLKNAITYLLTPPYDLLMESRVLSITPEAARIARERRKVRPIPTYRKRVKRRETATTGRQQPVPAHGAAEWVDDLPPLTTGSN